MKATIEMNDYYHDDADAYDDINDDDDDDDDDK